MDRGSLHHVYKQVALLIVKYRLCVQLVMALLVKVQVLHTQCDLFQISPSQGLGKGPELLN